MSLPHKEEPGNKANKLLSLVPMSLPHKEEPGNKANMLLSLVPMSLPHKEEPGNKANMLLWVASFPGLLSPNTVEGLVKLLRRMRSGGRLEAWLIAPYMHNTAVHQKSHASRCPPDVILSRSFTRPSTVLGDRRPGNEARCWLTFY